MVPSFALILSPAVILSSCCSSGHPATSLLCSVILPPVVPSGSLLCSVILPPAVPSDSLLCPVILPPVVPSDSLLCSVILPPFVPSDSLLCSVILKPAVQVVPFFALSSCHLLFKWFPSLLCHPATCCSKWFPSLLCHLVTSCSKWFPPSLLCHPATCCSKWFPPSLLCHHATFCLVIPLIFSLSLVATVQRLIHLCLSFILAICPAHVHFYFDMYSVLSVFFLLFLNPKHGTLYCSFIHIGKQGLKHY